MIKCRWCYLLLICGRVCAVMLVPVPPVGVLGARHLGLSLNGDGGIE